MRRSNFFERKLTNQFGGYLQGQYWFTNQWFLNAVWGMQRNYGFDRGQYASNNDQTKLAQQLNLTLWYRPIEALKFGLQYSYVRTDFVQNLNNPPRLAAAGLPQPNTRRHERGRSPSHRVRRLHVLLT